MSSTLGFVMDSVSSGIEDACEYPIAGCESAVPAVAIRGKKKINSPPNLMCSSLLPTIRLYAS